MIGAAPAVKVSGEFAGRVEGAEATEEGIIPDMEYWGDAETDEAVASVEVSTGSDETAFLRLGSRGSTAVVVAVALKVAASGNVDDAESTPIEGAAAAVEDNAWSSDGGTDSTVEDCSSIVLAALEAAAVEAGVEDVAVDVESSVA